ncbi:MAG: hypothetical protein QGG14_09395 [Planctomycetota bacterium]|nr:hypothetical protein [Planctomycetota bacterium]
MVARTPLLSLLLAPLAAAQTAVIAPSSNGPLVGVPSLISVTEGTVPKADSGARGLFKPVGFSTATPATLTPGEVSAATPDFSAAALFRGTACGAQAALPEIDAMSIGLDWIQVRSHPTKPRAVVAVPPGHWAGITFSVVKTLKGKHGQILGETTRTEPLYRGVGADLFSYIFPGSALPPGMVGITQRLNDAAEIRLPSDGEIDAVDVFASLFRFGIDPRLGLSIKKLHFYFSVTKATLALVPSSWWSDASKTSGASVFRCTFDELTGTWSCPKEFFSPGDLGLLPHDDLDAFAYDELQSLVLLSTAGKAYDPILFVDLNQDLAVAEPVYAGDKPISDLSGVGLFEIGNVDGICALDPTASQALQLTLGQPQQGNFPAAQFWAQTHRDLGNPKQPQQHIYRLQAVGGICGGWVLPVIALKPRGPLILFGPYRLGPHPTIHGCPCEIPIPFYGGHTKPPTPFDTFFASFPPTANHLWITPVLTWSY